MGTGQDQPDQLKNEEQKTCNDHETLETFTTAGFKMLVEATKRSNNLPIGKARDLYESFPTFHAIVDRQSNYTLKIMSSMLKRLNSGRNLQKKDDEDKFEMIVDTNDALLENVSILLDELSGIKKNPETAFVKNKNQPVSGSWNVSKKGKFGSNEATHVLNKILNQTKNIEKPQLKFKDKVNNDSNTPFEPRITYKHNLLKPLACIVEIDDYGLSQFSHPYEFELEKFEPSSELLMFKSPVMYKPLEETPLVLVNTPDDVLEMLKDLEKYTELAIDLEHHSYRSFQGFTCLMQISTRDKDYIIDALSLRSDLEVLNKVLTDPKIVKVFHGADLDILWLQRDLSLYVVNMFDTHQAAKLLNFPKLSLAYLLSHFCNVIAQKQYQLADWRIRPLPQELLTYAREDTHYLLYIYDNLKNSLLEKANNRTNLLKSVFSESTKICLKRYTKPVYEADGYLDLYRRSKKLFDNRQKFALERLYQWRDKVARELDESYAYVLPDHMMLNISEVLPREAQGILACCNPIPTLVRQNLLTLHQIILKAREQPLVKPILEEQRFYKYTSSLASFDDPLHCPHDLNHDGEFRDDLPILFSESSDVNLGKSKLSDTNLSRAKPSINVFESSCGASEKVKQLLVANKAVIFTPYHRYKLSKKFIESVEVKSTDEKPNAVKEEQRVLLQEKTSGDRVGDVNSKSSETDEDSLVNKEKKSGAEKLNSNTEEQMSTAIKRQIEDNSELPRKRKKADSNNEVTSSAHEKTKPDAPSKKKKRKNKILPGCKEKVFQPFDFNSVDYKKYQSTPLASDKKVKKKSHSRQRGRKGGKKKIGISI